MGREEELMRAYTKAKKGSKDYYEDFCTMLFDEVYRLVALVYDKESNRRKIVNHIFNKMRTRLDEFNPNMDDIHRWVSVFTSSMIYSVYSMSNSDIFTYKDSNSDFEATHIEEDDAFAECAVYYNDLITRNGFDKLNSVFVTLTKGQIILYELFCYAGCTVDEIEDLLEVDSVYVSSELCSIKNILMEDYAALGIVAESSQQDESYDEADSYEDGDNADDSDDGYEYEDDYETVNDRGLLDRVPEKALKLAVMCIIALILVIVLALILVIGGNDKDDKGSDSKETNSQQRETIWATVDFNGGSGTTIPTGGSNSSVSETDSESNSESNSTTDSQPTTAIPVTKPNRPTTPTQTSGETSGDNTGEGSGDASGDNAGEGSGDASGDNAGEGSGDASGDNTGEGSGDTSGDNTGEGSGDTSGDNAGEGSGDTSGDNTGEGSGDTSGDNAGEGSGDTSGDNTGEGSGDASGDSSESPADGDSEAASENPA